MADAPEGSPKQRSYISNDSSMGPDEFYDTRETLEKRMSSISRGSAATAYGSARSNSIYGSNRSAGGGGIVAAPTPVAAELIAHLASTGSGRKIDVGAAIGKYGGECDVDHEEFGSTTADEGPPGGSLGLDKFSTARLSAVGENEASVVNGNNEDGGAAGTAGNSRRIHRWPPPPTDQPQKIFTYEISSPDTTPNTTPGGHNQAKGNSDGLGGLWGANSPSPPPQKPSRPTNTNPFATEDTTTAGSGGSSNPSAKGSARIATVPTTAGRNPFAVNSKDDNAASLSLGCRDSIATPGGVAADHAGLCPPIPATAGGSDTKNSSCSKTRPPPLPPRRPLSLTRATKEDGGESPISVTSPGRSNATADSITTDAASTVCDATDGRSVGSSTASVDTTGAGIVEGGEGRAEAEDDSMYMVVNKDTGQIFDVRELERYLPADCYTTGLLPSRADLIALGRRRSQNANLGVDLGADASSSTSKKSAPPSPPHRHSAVDRTGRRTLSPSGRPSMSSVAASMAAAVGNSSTRKEKAKSLRTKVRKGLGKVATAAGAAGRPSAAGIGGGGGDETRSGDQGDTTTAGGGGGGGRSGGGIGAAARTARTALSGIRVSFKGKETSENLSDLMLLQELKAHEGPIWTAAFNHSGKFLATAGQDMKIVLHRVGDISKDPFAADNNGGNESYGDSCQGEEGGVNDDPAASPTSTPDTENAKGSPVSNRPPTGNTTPSQEDVPRTGSKPAVSPTGGDSSESSCGGGGRGARGGAPASAGDSKAGGEGSHRGSSRGKEMMLIGLEACQVFKAHRADVVALAWSRNDFLLSASLDKTVRLWHTTQPVCLHFFRHNDIVTAVDFHPLFEHFFLSGCFDKKVRVWNIRDGHVQLWQQAPDMVTAAKFSQDGSMIVAGLYMGQVLFYQTEGMRYFTQIECRNRRGAMKRGRKVTGFAFKSTADTAGASGGGGSSCGRSTRSSSTSPANRRSSNVDSRVVDGGNTGGGGVGGGAGGRSMEARSVWGAGPGGKGHVPEQLLVTTNDSRVRLYNTDDFVMNAKYKGLSNDTLQIAASFSEDGKQIISGSENGKVYVWSTGVTTKPPASEGVRMPPDSAAHAQSRPGSPVSTTQKDTNRSYESFEASQGDPKIVTFACFVPETTSRACVSAIRDGLNKTVADSGGYCGCMILATDYEGSIRVYCKAPILLS